MMEDYKTASDNEISCNSKEFTLSIETGIRGGSIALLKNNEVVDSSAGKTEVSKSEDILEEIRNLFLMNGIEKTKIKLIVFSRGPGSFTGIRIGIATALALSKSLDCNFLGISVLEAMTEGTAANRKVITAVNFGKNQVCWQLFKTAPKAENQKQTEIQSQSKPCVSRAISFFDEIAAVEFDELILQNYLYNSLPPSNHREMIQSRRIINAVDNLAVLIGRSAGRLENSLLVNQKETLQPIYIR